MHPISDLLLLLYLLGIIIAICVFSSVGSKNLSAAEGFCLCLVLAVLWPATLVIHVSYFLVTTLRGPSERVYD